MKHFLLFGLVLVFLVPISPIVLYSLSQEPIADVAPPPSPHRDPTIAELKLQIATLKMQLIQVQGQLLNCQAPAVFQEKAAAAAAVRAEREKQPGLDGTPDPDQKPPRKEPPAADK